MLLLILTAYARDRDMTRPPQPALAVSPEITAGAETLSDESTNGQEGNNDGLALAPPSVTPDSTGPALSPDEPIESITFPHQGITAVLWSPDSAKLAVTGADGAWLVSLIGDEATQQKLGDDAGQATSVAFSSTGELMAVGLADGLVQLWEVDNGQLIAHFAGHDAPVRSLAFSPDGSVLASGAGQWYPDFVPRVEGVETRLWDVATGKLLEVLSDDAIVPPVSHLAFSPDGAILAIGQQGHGCPARALG
jgi:WD40 repeat protein